MPTIQDVQTGLAAMQGTLNTLQSQLTKTTQDAAGLSPTPPDPTPPDPTKESANGTQVPPAASITDATAGVWTLSAGTVLLNGSPAGYTAGVVLLAYYGHTVFQQNDAGGWWSWTGGGWADATDPRPGPAPGPDPTPKPPEPAGGVGPAVPAAGFLDVDFAVPSSGRVIQRTLWGSSMACDGVWNSLPDNWGNPQAQAAAKNTAGFGLPGMYVRINSENAVVDGGGGYNQHGVDSTSQYLPKIMDVTTGEWSFGLGGTNDANAYARGAASIARRFIANGTPCMQYEINNETDDLDIGTYCNIVNATADALHAIDPKIQIVPTNDSWMHGDRMNAVAQRCGNRVARLHYHLYAVGPDRDDQNAMDTGINRFRGDAGGLRNAVNGTLLANVAAGIGEYNLCGAPPGDRRQTTVYGAVWNLAGLLTAFQVDPRNTHGAIWDWYGDGLYGLVIDPKSNPAGLPPFSVIPVGYALKLARQYVFGQCFQLRSANAKLLCVATAIGARIGLLVVNTDLNASYSGKLTLSHWPVNASGSKDLALLRLDKSHSSPFATSVAVSAGACTVAFPPLSVSVLTSA